MYQICLVLWVKDSHEAISDVYEQNRTLQNHMHIFFSWFLAFIHVLYITQVLPIIFPLKLIYTQIAYLY